jgi:hypothetical protein
VAVSEYAGEQCGPPGVSGESRPSLTLVQHPQRLVASLRRGHDVGYGVSDKPDQNVANAAALRSEPISTNRARRF